MDRSLPQPLARAHAWARAQPWLGRFTVLNRLLLALAFFPTGLVKLTGHRFTILPVEDPVGFFFEAMYRTGPYWRFIGFMQVAAAILLLVPWTSTLGALLFLPIGLSILLITWGVGFGNTVFVAAGMLLSAIYLVCWDGDRVWAAASDVLGRGARSSRPLLAGAPGVEWAGWILGGMAGMGLLLTTRSFLPVSTRGPLLLLGVASAALVIVGWAVALLRRR